MDTRRSNLSSAGRSIAGRSVANSARGGRQEYANTNQQDARNYQQPPRSSRVERAAVGGGGAGFEPHPVVPGLSTSFVPFNNVQSRSRGVRRAQTDKETLEKQRLKARTGGFHKYDEFQTIVGFEDGTPGFQSEAQRFDTDSAGEQKRLRELQYDNKMATYERRREEGIVRDERRWEHEQSTKQAEEEKWQHHREEKTFGKKNIGSVPYNQINLQYNDGFDGQELRYQDSMVKWRAMQRARRLQMKMMGDNVDPITGQPQKLLQVSASPDVARPVKREDIRDKHIH